MRIGFDAKRAFLNKAGLGNYSRTLLDLFAEYFADSELYLYTPKVSEVHFEAKNKAVTRIPKGIYTKFRSLWRTYGIKKQLTADAIDVFHGLAGELPVGIHKRGIKTVVTIHDLIFLRYPQWYKPTDRYIYNKKYKRAALIADKVVAISEQTKSDLVEFYKIPEQKIAVIYQGCNPVFYLPVSAEAMQKVKQERKLPNTFILFVSTVEPRKNLLNIFKGLQSESIDVPVVIVGRQTAYAAEVKQWLAENGMEYLALWQSYVPNADLPVLYAAATVFAYPSVFEGFGIPILEALNAGVPVITSTGSCFAEPGGQSSLYVNPEKPTEIGQAIKKVLNNTNLRSKMIADGKKHALRFRESVIMQQWKTLYEKLMIGG